MQLLCGLSSMKYFLCWINLKLIWKRKCVQNTSISLWLIMYKSWFPSQILTFLRCRLKLMHTLILCVPLSLLHRVTLGTISMKKRSEWHSQQVGPHSSFQPIIQMESAIQAGSLQVSFLCLHSSGQLCSVSDASRIYLALHTTAGLLSTVVASRTI